MKTFTYSLLGLVALWSLFLFGCDSPNKVHLWDTVSITYVATFPDASVFQETGVTFVVWSWTAIAWLEEGVLGMKANGTKKFTVTPNKWYGASYKPMLVQKISKLLFDKIKVDVKNGTFQKLGDNIVGFIKWVEKDTQWNELVLFDINPRETWQDISYKVTLVSKK